MVLSALVGCTPPLVEYSPTEPVALTTIRRQYERVVQEAKSDPKAEWHDGWVGNIFVNTLGGKNIGLCYQWQEYVYDRVYATVKGVHWDISGLTVNEGNGLEHHSVIVWDPAVINQWDILPTYAAAEEKRIPVYVLDAWHEGEPYVHWIQDWLDNEEPHFSPPRLQELGVPEGSTGNEMGG